MPIDFELDEDLAGLRDRVTDFVDDVVWPAQLASTGGVGHGPDKQLIDKLRAEARAAGIYAPTAPVEFGGLGLDHRGQAVVLEEAGRSLLGPAALNCAAPDEGNMLLLDRVANAEQKASYLVPLARGIVRSSFAMTEPAPGAGSDPSALLTTAGKSADGWVLDGRKWFITGADGADFVIAMAMTEQGATMFVVDVGNEGMTVSRPIETMDRFFAGGHCEIVFDHCVVSDDDVLGEVGKGFDQAQVRLAPARLTHCMRWLGVARRAHETAVAYASERQLFGEQLASLGMAQQMIADNEIDIAASRALIWHAAWALDSGSSGRQETSVAKVFVSEAVFRIVDRSVQLCGALGTSAQAQIAAAFVEVRPFRIYDGASEVHRRSIARRTVRRSRGTVPRSGS